MLISMFFSLTWDMPLLACGILDQATLGQATLQKFSHVDQFFGRHHHKPLFQDFKPQHVVTHVNFWQSHLCSGHFLPLFKGVYQGQATFWGHATFFLRMLCMWKLQAHMLSMPNMREKKNILISVTASL